MNQNDKKFTKTHEWVALEDGHGTVGITSHAQELLGDLVFVDLPPLGKTVQAGETLGVVESVKAAADFYAPVSGTVIELNSLVQNDVSCVNQAPQEHGWLVKLQLTNPNELEALLSHEQYLDALKSTE